MGFNSVFKGLIIFKDPVRTVDMFTLGYKTNQLMVCREIAIPNT